MPSDQTSPPPSGPLAGLRILDISTIIAAPVASAMLADFGAEVIKVELPGVGDPLRALPPHKDGVPLWWKVTNRNKLGITLDLRSDDGKDLFKQLIKKVDVLTENFRPGTMERYGLGPEVLHELNPELIILRVSGYGQTGPFAGRPGFARIAEAFAGFTSVCGTPDGPPLHIGYPVADAVTGYFGAIGVLVALYNRKADPAAGGEVIDCSLVDSMLRLNEFLVIEYDQLGAVRERSGNRSQYAGPSNVYRTKDDKWFSMSASAQTIWERLAKAIGRAELIEDARFKTNPDRVKNADALDEIIGAWFAERSLVDALEIFEANGVSGGPVNDARDIFNSEHIQAREAIIEVDDKDLGKVAMQNVFPRLAKAPGRVHSPGPGLGEHNEEVLGGLLGLDPAAVQELRDKGVI